MDPDMVPDFPWKQEKLNNPKSDEVSLNSFPSLPEDAILIGEILGFAQGKENGIGSIILEKVEGSDINDDQKEDLLNLLSLYHIIFIEGIEGLHQTPLLQFGVELNDYSSDSETLSCRTCFRRETEKTHSRIVRCWVLYLGKFSICFF
jgi:hypothetical protein